MNKEIFERNNADRFLQTGRILYEEDDMILIKELVEKKIKEKIENLKDKITIWDIDGTLCKFHYTGDDSRELLPCNDDDLKTFLKTHNMYNNARPLKIMQYIVNSLNPDLVYTLSTSIELAKLQKDEWLKTFYPKIKKENIFYSSSDGEKLIILEQLLLANKDKQLVFIEDTAKTLLNVEEKFKDIELQHILSFMV